MGQYDSWDNLTNFLKENPDNFEQELLKPPYYVKVKRHPQRPNLVMFNYDHYESDFTNPIVRCCRGSVYNITKDGTVKPFVMPFFKFANYGEAGADKINWDAKVHVRDKLNGTLLVMVKEADGHNFWVTNGSFDINEEVKDFFSQENEKLPVPYKLTSLRDYALRCHEEEIKNLPADWTFMFEFISPYRRIIVPYNKTKLYFLGCRDPEGREYTPEWASENFSLTFETPYIFPLKNMDAVLSYCEMIDTDDREGVVVQDKHFNRIKVKTEHYSGIHYLLSSEILPDDKIFKAVKNGTIEEAAAKSPGIRPKADEITAEWTTFKKIMAALCKKSIAYYQKCLQDYPDKDTALMHYKAAVNYKFQPFAAFLMEIIKETPNPDAIFNEIEYKDFKYSWLPAANKIRK